MGWLVRTVRYDVLAYLVLQHLIYPSFFHCYWIPISISMVNRSLHVFDRTLSCAACVCIPLALEGTVYVCPCLSIVCESHCVVSGYCIAMKMYVCVCPCLSIIRRAQHSQVQSQRRASLREATRPRVEIGALFFDTPKV